MFYYKISVVSMCDFNPILEMGHIFEVVLVDW